MMNKKLNLLLVLTLLSVNNLFSQLNKESILRFTKELNHEVVLNPLVKPIGNMGLQEEGLGLFEFNYKEKAGYQIGLKTTYSLKDKPIGFGIALNYFRFQIDFDYRITLPFYVPETTYYVREDGFIRFNFLGTRLFTYFQINDRLTLEAGVSFNGRLNLSSNPERTTWGGTTIYNVEINGENRLAGLNLREPIFSDAHPKNFIFPEFMLLFNITPRVELNAGIMYKFWQGKPFIYNLNVRGGSTAKEIYGTDSLQDTRFYRKYLFLVFGVAYNLNP